MASKLVAYSACRQCLERKQMLKILSVSVHTLSSKSVHYRRGGMSASL